MLLMTNNAVPEYSWACLTSLEGEDDLGSVCGGPLDLDMLYLIAAAADQVVASLPWTSLMCQALL